MPNLMQTGAAWLGDKLKSSAGRTVVIKQGGLTTLELTATLSQRMHEIFDDQGLPQSVASFDWIFTTADIVVSGSPVALRSGAQLIETINGVTTRYEAMDIGPKQAFEAVDTSGILSVLHTKRMR